MSHQDLGCKRAARTHADDLFAALNWLFPKNAWGGLKFREDCTWAPRRLAIAALLWAWSDLRPLTDRFVAARKIIKERFGDQHEPAESYQAFIKLLRKWTAPLLAQLQAVFRRRMIESLTRVWRVAGWLMFAVDGSRVDVPRTRRNEERYSPHSKLSREAQKRRRRKRRRRTVQQAQERKANVPRIWLTVLWHVGSGLPWAWRTGPSDSSERGHLEEMLTELPPCSLLTADAGFVGYELWRTIREAQHELLVRVGGNVKLLKKLGYARESGNRVYLWPDRAAARGQPPLVLRLVVVHNGRHPIYLVTSVLSTAALDDRQAALLYARRWGLEVFYRHCKQTFERRKLRSQNPDNAMIELHWSLLGVWAMGLHSHERLVRQGVSVQKISFAGVLRAYRLAMREHKSRPDPGERLTELLDQAILDGYQRKNKTARDYPRKKQEHAAGPPKILRATAHQTAAARQVKAELTKGLTA
jgi:hypothetical protein